MNAITKKRRQALTRSSPGSRRNPQKGLTSSPDHQQRRVARQQKASEKVRSRASDNAAEASPDGSPIRDIGNNRNVYPAKTKDGNTVFLPKKSEATAAEINKGLFVSDESAAVLEERKGREASEGGRPIRDIGKKRNVFPVVSANGGTVFLPKKSEATAAEINKGSFVSDESAAVLEENKGRKANKEGRPIRDIGKNRNVFPVVSANGDTIYLPKESEATAAEISAGRYVTDESVAEMEENKGRQADIYGTPVRDIGKNRNVYRIRSGDDELIFLPRKSEATDSEIEKGAFVTDESVALMEQIRKISKLGKPRFNAARNRVEYPYPEGNSITYLPKEWDASPYEKMHGLYVPNTVEKKYGNVARTPGGLGERRVEARALRAKESSLQAVPSPDSPSPDSPSPFLQ